MEKKKNYKVAFIVVLLIAIVLLGTTGYFYSKSRDNNEETPITNNDDMKDETKNTVVSDMSIKEYFASYVDISELYGSANVNSFLAMGQSTALSYGYFNDEGNREASSFTIVGDVLDEAGNMLNVDEVYFVDSTYNYVLLRGANESANTLFELSLDSISYDKINEGTKITAKLHHGEETIKDISLVESSSEDLTGDGLNSILNITYTDESTEKYDVGAVLKRN